MARYYDYEEKQASCGVGHHRGFRSNGLCFDCRVGNWGRDEDKAVIKRAAELGMVWPAKAGLAEQILAVNDELRRRESGRG